VAPIARARAEAVDDFAARAVQGADVVINAAGVAHLTDATPANERELVVGNVEVPAAIARAALRSSTSMIHVSSIKASRVDDHSPYAQSKRAGDEMLRNEFADSYESAGLCLLVIRPLALLLPPFEAGRLSKLTALRHWPSTLTPRIRMPALTAAVFLSATEALVDDALSQKVIGFRVREFARDEYATARDVRDAMASAREAT
jgi:hypothetical protein